jgi:hypothetical protein
VKLSGLELRRPRLFGSCWLGCQLWQQLGLDQFWDARLSGSREDVPWEKVLQLLVVNRLLDPGSEFRVHRQWYLTTAMDALLGTDFAMAEKNRLYRCLDRVLEHKQELFLWLRQKWADLFRPAVKTSSIKSTRILQLYLICFQSATEYSQIYASVIGH